LICYGFYYQLGLPPSPALTDNARRFSQTERHRCEAYFDLNGIAPR